MNGRTSERTIHPCIKIGKMVRVHKEYLDQRKDSTGLIGFDCERAKECGMGQPFSADNWVFDRSKCPLLRTLTNV
jgi:hypothetical protein